jgi:hypothetical protein
LASAFLAHPGRALDHHIRRIAFFDIEPANLVQIQRGSFTGPTLLAHADEVIE